MAYKFPWTNYHELNLDWILNTVKELFAKTEQNNAIVEQYDGRLTEVELTADNAQTAAEQAQQNSIAALDLAQGAQTTATQAQQAAAQAQQAAGQAQTAAGQAQEAAATAQQTATQAQHTAQNFDGRITQAEDNAESALQAAQAFDEQVQGAITAANNANEAATLALTTATETSRELAAQRSTLEGIVSDGVYSLEETKQDATEEIEAAGQTVLDSIPADYNALFELVDKKADVIYNTAAGGIASFNDGADGMPIRKLVAQIDPVQDLHGYDNPWPGGGGKNLLDFRTKAVGSDAGVTYTNNDGVITANGTASGYSYYQSSTFTLPAGTYTVNGRPSGSNAALTIYNANTSSGVANPAAGAEANFTLPEATPVYARIAIGNATATNEIFRPMIRLATETDATFAPYSNSCPISGHTGANIYHEAEYDADANPTISVNWEYDAGTVYGGTLDVTNGVLTVDKVISEENSANGWTFSGDGVRAYKAMTGIALISSNSQAPNIVCNYLKAVSLNSITTNRAIGIGQTANSKNVSIRINDTIANISELDAYLISNPLQIVYELATPIEYQLTPQEVKTLYQYNNIWSDVGSVDVEYPADTKTYIDNKFAELQALILEH